MTERMTERSVLLACDLDSQVFGALPLALAFAARGWRTTFAIESTRTLPREVLERLVGQFRVIERSISALPTDEEAFANDAIGVFVTGSRLALFRHTIELAAKVRQQPRPALFCGFNGLVFEKFEEGVAWRLGYDVIGLNGPRDQDAFVDFVHGSEFDAQPSVIVGLRRKPDRPQLPMKIPAPVEDAPLGAPPPDEAVALDPASQPMETPAADPEPTLDAPPADDAGATAPDAADADAADEQTAQALEDENGDAETNGEAPPEAGASAAPPPPKKLFVFAEQVVVPRNLRERQNLVATLGRLAKASPGWTVALKARVRPGEKTFHSQPNHIETLVKSLKGRPKNLQVTYEPLDSLLERADLFATISSTALFDAFDYGVPSLVATDFGLRNADGAHVFFASGLLVRLCDLPSLDDAPIRPPDERWINRMGYGDPYSPAALIDWLEAFAPASPLPPAFVSFQAALAVAAGSAEKASGVLKEWVRTEDALLARDGTPAGEAETPPAANPAASLGLLGFALIRTLAPNGASSTATTTTPGAAKPAAKGSSGERYEGPITDFSRRLGMYWMIKRTRLKLGLPILKRRE